MLTLSGPQGFYQTDNNHFPKFYYFWSTKLCIWFCVNTTYSFKEIFGDTRVPISLKGKT